MTAPSAFSLKNRFGRVAGLGWRNSGAPRVLALHGWLDNAASFVPLAPLLQDLDLVAIDLPGHGHSDHRHTSTRYHFIDYLFDIDATLDAMGWDDCHLVGHSLGAAISSAYAAGAPQRVRSVVLLDSMGPLSSQAAETADRLQRSLVKNRRGPQEPRLYDSIDDMVQARRSVSDLSQKAAKLLCDRAARAAGGKFTWRSDPALNWISSLVMTDEQALDLLRHIEAPLISFTVSSGSDWFSEDTIRARLEAIAHGRHEFLDGHHHFHMDEPEKVGETIRSFILDNNKPTGKVRSTPPQ